MALTVDHQVVLSEERPDKHPHISPYAHKEKSSFYLHFTFSPSFYFPFYNLIALQESLSQIPPPSPVVTVILDCFRCTCYSAQLALGELPTVEAYGKYASVLSIITYTSST